jgi:hypothetical protein
MKVIIRRSRPYFPRFTFVLVLSSLCCSLFSLYYYIPNVAVRMLALPRTLLDPSYVYIFEILVSKMQAFSLISPEYDEEAKIYASVG